MPMDIKDEIYETHSQVYPNDHRRCEHRSRAPCYQYPEPYIIHPMSRNDAFKRAKSSASASLNMSPEMFERLYLTPPKPAKGYGNPMPIAIVGFIICLTPLSCDLMGWRGAGGNGAAGIGSYFFFGGLLMFIGGILEWVIGNTFPSVVFLTFSAFWFTFGATLNPSFAAFASYAPPGATSAAEGLTTKGFNASFGFFNLAMAMICFVFLVCSLRTNFVFFFIFSALTPTYSLITAAYWYLAMDFTGNSAFAAIILEAAGACAFAAVMAGWYLFFSILLESLDFPFWLPVGDLSRVIPSKSAMDRV